MAIQESLVENLNLYPCFMNVYKVSKTNGNQNVTSKEHDI